VLTFSSFCRGLATAPFALALLASTALAQDPNRISQIVQAQADAEDFSGAVLVSRDGQIVFDQGYGLANREWNIANDGQTKFRLGSVSKQFTAASILLLAEQGKVELDAPITTWITDAPATWNGITLRHLMSHTSGIANFTDFPEFASQSTLPATLDSLIARFKDRPLDFQTGTRFRYSNSGYILLTAIIEKASSQSYESFVNENIFTPLGMKDSGYDRHTTILSRRASGYTPTASGPVNANYTDMSIPAGAGALYSTTHDLMKWNEALYGGKLLQPASLAQMITPTLDTNALGLFVREENNHKLVWHNGAIEGFNTYLAWDPETRSSIVVLGNLNGAAPDVIGAQLAALVQGQAVTLASERVAIALSATELEEYVGAYPLAPTFVITIRTVDGKLQAQATGQAPFDIHPESKDRFFLTNIDAQLSFTRNADGKVDGLVLHQNGQEMPAAKATD